MTAFEKEVQLCHMLAELCEHHYITDRNLLQSTLGDYKDVEQMYNHLREELK